VRPCPIFASYTLAFALQLRKKHGKTSVYCTIPPLCNLLTPMLSYTLALEKYRFCCCFKTITLALLNNNSHYALYTTIATLLLASVAFCKYLDCRDGVDKVFILLDVTLCRIPAEQRLKQRSPFINMYEASSG
jgi:hypothetical protein